MVSKLAYLFFIYTVSGYVTEGCSAVPDGTYPMRNLTEFIVCSKGNGTIDSCNSTNEIYSTNQERCVEIANLTLGMYYTYYHKRTLLHRRI